LGVTCGYESATSATGRFDRPLDPDWYGFRRSVVAIL